MALHPKTYEEALEQKNARVAKRRKRSAPPARRLPAKASVVIDTATGVVHELAAVVTVNDGPRRFGEAFAKGPAIGSGDWLDIVRAMPCSVAGCGARTSNAHHFPPRSVMGRTRVDVLSAPFCGSGTTGHHGECHAGRISQDEQAEAVGTTIANVLLAALASVPRRDHAETIRLALVRRLSGAATATDETVKLREALNSILCLAVEGPECYPLAGKRLLDLVQDVAKEASAALAATRGGAT